ncbi:SH3 domain-containing protein [Roseovarius nubinhibens]|uniref:SH3 domain-containing protein n=1 Tax=Roseovarius nubinhibens TaxID=314263 RepID=UPI001C08C5AA|nr:SH3 domain-containing protein [Roseovarius nubinhibens]MBU2999445.1 SH3 domain-containing protein [Roseovarius nubinhibens]
MITFGFLGFAFYELSGGADYAPSDNSLQAHMQRDRAERQVAAASATPAETPVSSAAKAAQASPEVTLATVKAETLSATSGQDAAIDLALAKALQDSKGTPPATEATEAKVTTAAQTVIGLGELTGRTGNDTGVNLVLASAGSADPSGMGALGQGLEYVQVAAADSRNVAGAGQSASPSEAKPEENFVVLSTDRAPDMREVTGNVVNMRSGPGTKYGRLDQLNRGAKVEVLEDMGNGWLRLRVEETGRVGYMAARLVSGAG